MLSVVVRVADCHRAGAPLDAGAKDVIAGRATGEDVELGDRCGGLAAVGSGAEDLELGDRAAANRAAASCSRWTRGSAWSSAVAANGDGDGGSGGMIGFNVRPLRALPRSA